MIIAINGNYSKCWLYIKMDLVSVTAIFYIFFQARHTKAQHKHKAHKYTNRFVISFAIRIPLTFSVYICNMGKCFICSFMCLVSITYWASTFAASALFILPFLERNTLSTHYCTSTFHLFGALLPLHFSCTEQVFFYRSPSSTDAYEIGSAKYSKKIFRLCTRLAVTINMLCVELNSTNKHKQQQQQQNTEKPE